MGSLVKCASTVGINLLQERNLTNDYYMTSIISPEHFGRHSVPWTLRKVLIYLWMVISDPCWPARMVWLSSEAWMWQFKPADIDNSIVNLLWLVFDAKEANPDSDQPINMVSYSKEDSKGK